MSEWTTWRNECSEDNSNMLHPPAKSNHSQLHLQADICMKTTPLQRHVWHEGGMICILFSACACACLCSRGCHGQMLSSWQKGKYQKAWRPFWSLKTSTRPSNATLRFFAFFFAFPLLTFTLLSVSFTFNPNSCPVAPGNQFWTDVNDLVWFDRPCWQPPLCY